MKSLFLTLLFALLLAPSLVYANDITTSDISGFNDLTDVQKAEIAMQIAKTNEANITTATTLIDKVTVAPENVDKWVDVGEKIGKMLGGTAKELGVAADEIIFAFSTENW